MNNLKAFIEVIKKLGFILTSKQKRDAIGVFVSMIVCAIAELLGVSIIAPFLKLLTSSNTDEKWYYKLVQFVYPSVRPKEMLVFFCLAIIVVYIIKNAVVLLCTYIRIKYSARVKRELSTLMLDSYVRRPYEFFVNKNSSEIIRGVNSDTNAAYSILSDSFQFCTDLLSVLFIGAYLLYMDWAVASASLALSALCFLLLIIGFKKRMKEAGRENLSASANQYKYCIQAVNGIKEIIVTDRRDIFVKQYEKAAKEFERTTVVNNFISACPDRILEGVCIGGFIGIAMLRLLIGGNYEEFVPVLGSFAMGAFKILPSISKMSTRINSIVFNQPGLENCYENIAEAREIKGLEKQNTLEKVESGDTMNYPFEKSIVVENIKFKYSKSENNILENASIVINKGESVALIGSSGAGKTTLADLILGLYIPQNGRILKDGVEIQKIPHIWSKTVGYVPQSVFLTDDTFKANIAFGLPAEEIDEEKVWKAVREAQLEEFVKTLPNGLDTVVGERGVKISGGQRQRVAIARALYDSPDVLVLDEATSALDSETEKAVMESIDSLIGHKTLLIIAHRLSTIRNCDRVYEIKDGRAIEKNKEDVLFDS